MTAEQKSRFLELAKQSEQLKEKQEEIRAEMTAVMVQLQIKGEIIIQDPETLAVYKIVKPNGTFMYYRDVDYVRTALPGERAGTLSKKEAESLGFILSK